MMTSKLDAHFIEEYRERNTELETINAALLEALEHAVNWGHGFEGTGTRPEWLTEAEEAIRKASR